MTSVLKLSEVVDVVIGVDTHVQTHAAAAVDARTGGVLAQITIEATGEGYAELVEFADQVAEEHGALRAWAIEGTASHGRGLAVHLSGAEEFVIELDRPERAARRGGVKSDPTDAIRPPAKPWHGPGSPPHVVAAPTLTMLRPARRWRPGWRSAAPRFKPLVMRAGNCSPRC